MDQILPPCARTTLATRHKTQDSQKSAAKLVKQYGIKPNLYLNGKNGFYP